MQQVLRKLVEIEATVSNMFRKAEEFRSWDLQTRSVAAKGPDFFAKRRT